MLPVWSHLAWMCLWSQLTFFPLHFALNPRHLLCNKCLFSVISNPSRSWKWNLTYLNIFCHLCPGGYMYSTVTVKVPSKVTNDSILPCDCVLLPQLIYLNVFIYSLRVLYCMFGSQLCSSHVYLSAPPTFSPSPIMLQAPSLPTLTPGTSVPILYFDGRHGLSTLVL